MLHAINNALQNVQREAISQRVRTCSQWPQAAGTKPFRLPIDRNIASRSMPSIVPGRTKLPVSRREFAGRPPTTLSTHRKLGRQRQHECDEKIGGWRRKDVTINPI